MKTRTTAIMSVAIAGLIGSSMFVGTALAERRAHGRHHEHRHERTARLLESFDLDGNGILTQEEVDQARRERFARFDADNDGKLTLQEYEALWLDAMRDHLTRRFERLDGDDDSAVSPEEFVAPFGDVIQRLDTNEDGQITQDEVSKK